MCRSLVRALATTSLLAATVVACGGSGTPLGTVAGGDETGASSQATAATGTWQLSEASAREAGLLALTFTLADRDGVLSGTMALSGVVHDIVGTRSGSRLDITVVRPGSSSLHFVGDLTDARTLRGQFTTPGFVAAPLVLVRE